MKDNKLVVFQDKKIRRILVDDEWFFSVVDVVAALTDSLDPGAYWRKLKQRLLAEGSQVVTFCHGLKLPAPDGKMRSTDCANVRGMFRIIQETFKGKIELDPTKGGNYGPVTGKGAGAPEPKEPLDEIIDKINEKYKGIFTEGDKVLLTSLRDRLLTDKKLKKIIQTTEPKIFTESVFPKIFDDAAQASFMESSETYQTLFADAAKYKAIMNALAQILYRDLK